MKKSVLGIALISALFTAGSVFAADNMNKNGGEHSEHQHDNQAEHKEKQPTEENKHTETVNAGNKTCPVMGEKINEKTKVTYEYKGKTYNFCCAACIDEFKKNPEKYIEKLEKEKKNN